MCCRASQVARGNQEISGNLPLNTQIPGLDVRRFHVVLVHRKECRKLDELCIAWITEIENPREGISAGEVPPRFVEATGRTHNGSTEGPGRCARAVTEICADGKVIGEPVRHANRCAAIALRIPRKAKTRAD